MNTSAASQSIGFRNDLPRGVEAGFWIGMVLLAYAAVTVLLSPNPEHLPLSLRLYAVAFNTAVGAVNGFLVFDRWAMRRRGLFLAAAAGVIGAAALFHEAVMEAMVFRLDAVNLEGLYYSVRDAFWTSVVFVGLRTATGAWQAAASGNARPVFAPDHLLIKVSGGPRRVDPSDILYIRAERDFSRVVCANREYFASETLKALLEKTARFGVVRVHKSFAVNLNRVDRMGRTEAELGAHRVPVGRKYARDSLLAWRRTERPAA